MCIYLSSIHRLKASPSKRPFKWVLADIWKLKCGLLLLASIFTPHSEAQEPDISFGAVRLLNSTPEYVELEIGGKYNGSLGQLNLAVSARSTDGTIRSYGTLPVALPSGGYIPIKVRVFSPSGLESQETDGLVAKIYQGGNAPFLRKTIEWHHVWPEVKVASYSVNNGRKLEPARDALRRNLVQTLYEEDFESIERLVDKWIATKGYDADGYPNISNFGPAIRALLSDGNWRLNRQIIQKWRRKFPSSPISTIAEAIYWIQYAKDSGNNKQDSNEDDVRRRLFTERIRKAESLLASSQSLAETLPAWQEARLEIATLTETNSKQIELVFQEGVARFPHHAPFYIAMVDYWINHNEESARYDKAANILRTLYAGGSSTKDDIFYAAFFNEFSSRQLPDIDLLINKSIFWSEITPSFNSLIAKYRTPVNLNYFAAAACRANDRKAYLSVRYKLNNILIPSVWPSNFSPDLCDHRFLYFS